jgi:hypothetical protein
LDRAVTGGYPGGAAGVPVVYPDYDDVVGECGVVVAVVVDPEDWVRPKSWIYFDRIGYALTLQFSFAFSGHTFYPLLSW